MVKTSHSSRITLLDGGMGRELLRIGAPFRQPEWSALSLIEAPDLVRKVHESFAAAGSDILTTSNYAVVPFHIGENRFSTEGNKLTALSGQLARQAASSFGCKVAGSIPPIFGSYRPDFFVPKRAPALLKIIIDALSPHVDIWLAETTSSISKAQAVAEALAGDNRPLWISFTLLDGRESQKDIPRLRSNQKVSNAVNSAVELGASAILFNCSQPEVMSPAIDTAIRELKRLKVDLPIGVYANAFPAIQKVAQANSTIQEIRPDLDPAGYLTFVDTWCRLGATIIGGCCGIGPEHIATLHESLKMKEKSFPPSEE
ncbi:homocysteine S-methyltransferase family protein [Desulfopila aestuarii]|uniref:Homocysteine/selenocysteine methylase (S-methylmethionine-dependent) n=1 Tax=Desulfopila aestuarii DSM 18488 TaxID=1121416 RepID=A0A1M7Y3R8_9BACT|nr:homocysteine S-methyltransferase family protein [Desulfopila aestuarii]SHO46698.1 Homocysteine/selenocysteine methylase (S-methylmethionine-dependent) [Desulfopila aestuarii DSM 18488]